MTVFAMFSDKGSPGVTTLGLALASVWPRAVALVEADPAGGDLARRLTDSAGHPLLAREPSVLTLAAAARRAVDPSLVWTHSQRLPSGGGRASVVPGIATPEQATAMAELWAPLICAVGTSDRDVLVDLGRLDGQSPARPILDRCDVLLAVARGEAAAMIRLRDRLRFLGAATSDATASPRVAVVLVTDDRTTSEATAAISRVLSDSQVGADVAGAFVVDPGAVASLHRAPSDPRIDRSLLLRSASAIAMHIKGDAATGFSVPSPRRRLLARAR